jgi:hypothetical protein
MSSGLDLAATLDMDQAARLLAESEILIRPVLRRGGFTSVLLANAS